MARLLFRDSQGREGTVELSPTETVYVGRGLECAIRTDDGMVSRRHAQFRMENGRFVVEDLGSANGTHLNSTRIQKQAIGHADVIQCGSLVIRFIDEGGVNVVPQQIPMGGAAAREEGRHDGARPRRARRRCPAVAVGGRRRRRELRAGTARWLRPASRRYGGRPACRRPFGATAGDAERRSAGDRTPPNLPYGGPPRDAARAARHVRRRPRRLRRLGGGRRRRRHAVRRPPGDAAQPRRRRAANLPYGGPPGMPGGGRRTCRTAVRRRCRGGGARRAAVRRPAGDARRCRRRARR